MTKRLTGFTVLAVTLLVLASVPMFNQASAVAQAEAGVPGACVSSGVSCVDLPSDSCIAFGGVWYGEGSFCAGNVPCDSNFTCPTRSTACCLGTGTCVAMVPDLCVEAGGTPSPPPFTPCSQVTCDQPCYGDVDGDGMVGINDFLDLLAAWGDCK